MLIVSFAAVRFILVALSSVPLSPTVTILLGGVSGARVRAKNGLSAAIGLVGNNPVIKTSIRINKPIFFFIFSFPPLPHHSFMRRRAFQIFRILFFLSHIQFSNNIQISISSLFLFIPYLTA